MEHEVIIIGAGWAGLSCAYTLAKKGIKPLLIEAAPNAGGRARSIKFNENIVDNGQHLLVGAYKNTLNILKELNIPFDEYFHQTNLNITTTCNFSKFVFKLPSLFYPLNLIAGIFKVKGCSLLEKFKLLKFCLKLKLINFNLKNDTSIYEYLKQNGQSNNIIKYFWEPIALAACSTSIHTASADVFLKVLKGTFSAPRFNSDFLFTKLDLSSIFVDPVINYIQDKATLMFNKRVKHILYNKNKKKENIFTIKTQNEEFYARNIVIATPPNKASKLLKEIPKLASLQKDLEQFTYENIITIYFEFPNNINQELPMHGLIDSIGHWFFDRRVSNQPNILSIIITSNKYTENYTKERLIEKVFTEIQNHIPNLEKYTNYKMINEKQAAFTAKVNINKIRPNNKTSVKNLYLAGDYTKTNYPATLEGAVYSGINAAKHIVNYPLLKHAGFRY